MADIETQSRDLTGIGHGRPAPSYIPELVEVGPGKPMGELLRRYWQPVAISADVKDLPLRRRIMGENLIIFRDGKGRPGAVYESCAHRGASLFFGRVDDEGIRCCYHGWMFDVEGRCVNQPLEDKGGKCAAIRQPWYPVEERYGLVFIYMGPADQIPLLPRYEGMENLGEDEYYTHRYDSMPGAESEIQGKSEIIPSSWLINMDNIQDLSHLFWMHHLHSGPQFGPFTAYVTMDNAAALQDEIKYVETENGLYSEMEQPMDDGSIAASRLETHMPNLRVICPPVRYGNAFHMSWCVPVDDTSHYNIGLARTPRGGIDITINPMSFWDRSDPEVVQRKPSDNEAMSTQGPLPRHSEEHLVLGDRGVGRQRRMFQRQLKALAAGERLMNLRFHGEDPVIPTFGAAWEAKPAPEGVAKPVYAAAPGEMPADLVGKWKLTLETPMGNQDMVFAFLQNGSTLFGSMTTPEGDEIKLKMGNVEGSQAVWQVDVTTPITMTMLFEVRVDDATMSGTFKPGAFPAGAANGFRLA